MINLTQTPDHPKWPGVFFGACAVRVDVSSNVSDHIRDIDRMSKDYRFATASALTLTAKAAQREMQEHMNSVFDRPSPFTRRSLFTKPARKSDLTASVEIKDAYPSKSRYSPDDVLRHQVNGGQRVRKGLEVWFERAGMISSNEWIVPGDDAKLDAYGNLSRGQTSQIMSQLRLGHDPYAWASKSARSKRNVKKAGVMFWSRGGHLKRGVWMRAGRTVRCILLVAKGLHYTPQLDKLHAVGQTVADREFPIHFDAAMKKAIETSWSK